MIALVEAVVAVGLAVTGLVQLVSGRRLIRAQHLHARNLAAWEALMTGDADQLAAIEQSLETCVERGWMEHAGVDDEGRQLYRLTRAGEEAVEAGFGDQADDETEMGPRS